MADYFFFSSSDCKVMFVCKVNKRDYINDAMVKFHIPLRYLFPFYISYCRTATVIPVKEKAKVKYCTIIRRLDGLIYGLVIQGRLLNTFNKTSTPVFIIIYVTGTFTGAVIGFIAEKIRLSIAQSLDS